MCRVYRVIIIKIDFMFEFINVDLSPLERQFGSELNNMPISCTKVLERELDWQRRKLKEAIQIRQ